MAFLQIYRDRLPVMALKLTKTLYKIGRSPSSDIVLEDSSASRDHGLLILKDSEWWFDDLSRNGIELKDQTPSASRLTTRFKLKESEALRVTRHLTMVLHSTLNISDDKTLMISRQPTQVISVDADARKLRMRRALIEVVSGAESQRLEIPPQGLSIGSHSSNDLSLQNTSLSRFHATIQQAGDEFILSDLQSTNGTSVNGIRSDRSVLQNSSRIRLGDVELKFIIEWEDRLLTPSSSQRLMGLVSDHPKMRSLFSLMEIVAPTDTTVLIHGETGTGKELVAQAIHRLSSREQKPFIALNCAALPTNLIESELFGHEKGSFTGAMQTHIGAFEAADGGTLFLDEVGELDLTNQAKLLRVLESREIRRVGSSKSIRISVRIVGATHRHLKDDVKAGRFREDLYYRLYICPLHLPPLRERLEDLPLLAQELLNQLGSNHQLSDEALKLLRGYHFPGNIRELKNLLQRALLEFQRHNAPSSALVLRAKDFVDLQNEEKLENLSAEEEAHRRTILEQLQRHNFNQSRAAEEQGVPISTYNDWVRRYGIEKPKTRMRPKK